MALRVHLLSALRLCVPVIALCVPVGAASAAESDFPYIVRCTSPSAVEIFYLSEIKTDGTAIYMSPDRQAATITATGGATKVLSAGLGDCAGKTIEELRTGGQAVDLK